MPWWMPYIEQVQGIPMKPYPLGIDNPIVIRGEIGSSRWALYWKDGFQKIASFPNEYSAYEARRAILKSEGYDA